MAEQSEIPFSEIPEEFQLPDDEETEKEREKEGRRKGCCLVGCLILLLLLILFLLALFLPVKVAKERPEKGIEATGAAKFQFISAQSYINYNGHPANSKGLITILTLRLTNIDRVAHLPNQGMVFLLEEGYAQPYPVDDQTMVNAVYPARDGNPWNKVMEPGESRTMRISFMIPRPGTGDFVILVKDFNWTSPEFKRIPIGKIPGAITEPDPHIVPKDRPKDQSF